MSWIWKKAHVFIANGDVYGKGNNFIRLFLTFFEKTYHKAEVTLIITIQSVCITLKSSKWYLTDLEIWWFIQRETS